VDHPDVLARAEAEARDEKPARPVTAAELEDLSLRVAQARSTVYMLRKAMTASPTSGRVRRGGAAMTNVTPIRRDSPAEPSAFDAILDCMRDQLNALVCVHATFDGPVTVDADERLSAA